jgi:hypothetical protein
MCPIVAVKDELDLNKGIHLDNPVSAIISIIFIISGVIVFSSEFANTINVYQYVC